MVLLSFSGTRLGATDPPTIIEKNNLLSLSPSHSLILFSVANISDS